ncbi:predicted protein [Nematostella vectensis]|uniref:Uncharacterized protein n=1 Tax=Nematostella vectensis TaxID=45351 RepID=A7S280_NEMVE|nr:predicted protein [Nematostella vectensis]|eukprot:XP_001634301.1 predicted protein [Nematostella vectensis]
MHMATGIGDEPQSPQSRSLEILQHEQERLKTQNKQLQLKLRDGSRVKHELQQSKETGMKLLSERNKLFEHLVERQSKRVNTQHQDDQQEQTSYRDIGKALASQKNERAAEQQEKNLILLKTQLGALKFENFTLIQEKRKSDEQRGHLVQELAALNGKFEQLSSKFSRLQAENQRLSQIISERGNIHTIQSKEEDDIEALKAQVRIIQEEYETQRAIANSAERINRRLKDELSEAHAIIRDMRTRPSEMVGMYSELQPVYKQIGYVPRERAYPCRPLDYFGINRWELDGMRRTCSNDDITSPRKEKLPHGIAPRRRPFLTPDMTAVVDSTDSPATHSL